MRERNWTGTGSGRRSRSRGGFQRRGNSRVVRRVGVVGFVVGGALVFGGRIREQGRKRRKMFADIAFNYKQLVLVLKL